ncbi:MFS efflux transporter [Scheffersomyces xylosifermentans]|uniref:MFS efflux transporter n=1 Tax=Scheffersomyces xylosifermentans TaxID=1304137 RepID=UPI00315CD68C
MSYSPDLKKKDNFNVTIHEKGIATPNSELSDQLGDAHYNELPTRKIITILLTLSMANMVSFADQTGITVGLSSIAKDLGAETTINWAGTASLLANCVCQILFGRLSDIFGRKTVLMSCLGILVVGDVACSVAKSGVEFYIFRAIAGIGNGGVSSLSMVILSDIVSLKDRGKYQGILGSSVGIGNAVGPFLMSAFIKVSTWRSFYYFLAPLGVVVNIAVYFLIEGNGSKLDKVLTKREKFKKIDYLGILVASLSLTLLLVAISGGGSSYAWNSPLVIVFLVVGGLAFIAFLLIEWKVPELPMIPLNLFKNISMCLLMTSTFLFGAAYYSFLYYVPYYFQIVKSKSELQTSVFLLPLVLCQAGMSAVAGQLISRTGHYLYVVCGGYALWLLACGLLVLWDDKLSDGINIVVMLIMGTGVGFSFQPSMVAVQANCRKAERAVAISTRNVLRSFGGAVGIAVGSTIVSNTILSDINNLQVSGSALDGAFLENFKKHVYEKLDISNLSAVQIQEVINLYIHALRNYFYLLIPFMGICFISSGFIRDRGLQCIDEIPESKKKDFESAATSSATSSYSST